MFGRHTIFALSLLLLTVGCNAKRDTGSVRIIDTPTPTPTTAASTLSCTATPATPSIEGGRPLSISVRATGGSGSYRVDAITFSGTTTTTRTYSGTSTARLMEDTITVTDTLNATTTCAFRTIVNPVGTSGTNGGCVVSVSNSSPRIGENVTFSLMALGGTPPYRFEFNPNNGNTIPWVGTYGEGVTATATVSYSTSGLKNAWLSARDANFNYCNRSQEVNVRPAPTVTAVGSPSTTVNIGSSIQLTATGHHFASTNVTYAFSTTEAGISIAQNGNLATITAPDLQYHRPRIRVVATSGSETAETYIDVTFAVTGFSCQVTKASPSGNILINDDVTFNVTSNTGNVEIQTFSAGANGVLQTGLTNPVRVRYGSAGTKTISVTARDAASKTPCNLGAAVNTTVVVGQPLACDAWVVGSASVGSDITATASAPGHSDISITNITSSAGSGLQWIDSPNYSNAWKIRFTNVGVFPVYITIRDSAQRTATCTTAYHHAYAYVPVCRVDFTDPYGFLINTMRAHDRVRIFVNTNNNNFYGQQILQTGGTVTNPPPSGWTNVLFPNSTPDLRYTQNHAGWVTATASVRVDSQSLTRACTSRSLYLTEALSCSLSKASSTVLANNSWYKQGSLTDCGTLASPIGITESAYNSGAGFSRIATNITISAGHKSANVTYNLNANNGLGVVSTISPNVAVALPVSFATNGVYPLDATVTDTYDALGNSCSLRDADLRYASNRQIVDSKQNIKFKRPVGNFVPSWGEYCRVHVKNMGDRVNKVSYYNGFTGAYVGDLSNISPGASQSITMNLSGTECATQVKAFGAHTYSPGVTSLSNGSQRFEVTLEVRYYSAGWRNSFYRLRDL